jgi:hypothetical protein
MSKRASYSAHQTLALDGCPRLNIIKFSPRAQ